MKYLNTKVEIHKINPKKTTHEIQLLNSISSNLLFSKQDCISLAKLYAEEKKCDKAKEYVQLSINKRARLRRLQDTAQINGNNFPYFKNCNLLTIFKKGLIQNTKGYSHKKNQITTDSVKFAKIYSSDQFMRSNDSLVLKNLPSYTLDTANHYLWKLQLKLDSLNEAYVLNHYLDDSLFIQDTFYYLSDDAKYTLFLVGQHSDYNLSFQKKMLDLFVENYAIKGIRPSHLAYLVDRYLLNTKGYQLFGTQFQKVNGQIQPKKLRYPDKVEDYRKVFNMHTLKDYLKGASKLINKK